MKIIPLLILILLSACAPKTDEDCASKSELDSANTKIESLQSQLALMGNNASSIKKQDNPLTQEKPKKTTIRELESGTTDKQWSYTQDEDAMTGEVTYHAFVVSSNTLESNFPHNLEQYARLILRSNSEFGKNIIIQIDKGQFQCSLYEKCSVLVRFDDDKPIRFDATITAENVTGTIFIYDYSKFKAEMLSASRLRISADIYGRNAPVFEFDIRDFSQKKYESET